MKKFLPLVLAVVVAVVIAVVFFIQKRLATERPGISSVLPAETLVLMHLPNVPGTREAWRNTSLRMLTHEADVAAYLELVERAIPYFTTAKAKLDAVAKVEPIQAFIAVTDDAPTVIAGLEFSGSRSDVEVLLSEAKSKMQEMVPTGRLDIAMHAGHELQMFHFRNKTIAGSFHHRWYLISNSVDLLERTLDNLVNTNPLASDNLAGNSLFEKCVAMMPQNPDAFLFVQTDSLIDRLLTLLRVSGQRPSLAKVKQLQKVRAFSAAIKLDGQNIRDATFVLKPGEKVGEPLEKTALAFTSAQTELFYASKFEIPDEFELPDTSLDMTGVLQVFKRTIAAFESRGITLNEVRNAFGPEFGTMLAWRENRTKPVFLMILDVKDFEIAKRLLDTAAETKGVGAELTRREIEGGVFYSLSHNGFSWFRPPVIALSSNYAVVGLSLEDIIAGLEQAVSGKRALLTSSRFDEASASVIAPTRAFAYVDARALFNRFYPLVQTFLTAWSAVAPPSNPLMEPAMLPSVDSITKNLGPMVYSQAEVTDGVVTESVGPVTVSQSLIVAALGGSAAIYPVVKQKLKEGTLLSGIETFQWNASPAPSSIIPHAPAPAPEEPLVTDSAPSPN